ncbi:MULTISPECIES: DUF1826 domain-containing protein [Acetobacteraceae]|uniref:DUF1826 domain-containing protein n=2 Tax=Acetobacteraceae TaxID=433 RepID=A0A850P1I2_9PROT|nr:MULTISPECIES: DUF1826 domain-containing protein [Acetobacteraceae]ASL40375.1 hypothetical protein CBI36_07925 [Acetobacter oryzifermentans]KAA8425737.1 DUF1826 domain-containing protein [Acetobacter pomorum]KAA8435831.1 DUF1826 domain-containing protein [Acetobacter pomorum]KAA8446132.1 DUF1826 domain-containing protein [Acetobacter pomorum]MCG0996258.1 DUF1826 domain-containing protein [Acetobacter indonesiensis]
MIAQAALSAVSGHVVAGDSHTIVDELMNPAVMAAIWRQAWSPASLAFAASVTQLPNVNVPYSPELYLVSSQAAFDARSNDAFFADLGKIRSVFQDLAIKLLGSVDEFDYSRTEPALCDEVTGEASDWHIDKMRLGLFSIPGGITTEYLDTNVDGRFDPLGIFSPNDPELASASAKQLPNDAALFMKCAQFHSDIISSYGLVHRRPTQRLEQFPDRGRVVIHIKV